MYKHELEKIVKEAIATDLRRSPIEEPFYGRTKDVVWINLEEGGKAVGCVMYTAKFLPEIIVVRRKEIREVVKIRTVFMGLLALNPLLKPGFLREMAKNAFRERVDNRRGG